MKRLSHDKEQFDLLRVFEAYARSKEISMSDKSTVRQFVKDIPDTIKKHLNRDTLLHGTRVQSMFAYITAALGECSIINEEDSGTFYSSESNVRRPDFRFLKPDGESFFIEVKNFHPKDPLKSYNAKAKYIESLMKYTKKFNIPLKIAIYWSRWEIWMLIDIEYFDKEKSQYIISLPEAMKRNEMSSIGDRTIGTEYPLSLRLYTDPDKPHHVDKMAMHLLP